MTSLPSYLVKVTLTDEQWTTILARLAMPTEALSLRGRAVYRAAFDGLAAQLKAALEQAESQQLAVAALKAALEEPNFAARLEPAEFAAGGISMPTREPRPNPRTADGGPAILLMLPGKSPRD